MGNMMNLTTGASASSSVSYPYNTYIDFESTKHRIFFQLRHLFCENPLGDSSDARRRTTVVEDVTLTANFAVQMIYINVFASTGGSVNSSINGSYVYGTEVTITATPHTGWSFLNWSDGSTEQSRTITLTEPPGTSLTANFVENN